MGKTYKANSDQRYDQESKQAKQNKKLQGMKEKALLKTLGA